MSAAPKSSGLVGHMVTYRQLTRVGRLTAALWVLALPTAASGPIDLASTHRSHQPEQADAERLQAEALAPTKKQVLGGNAHVLPNLSMHPGQRPHSPGAQKRILRDDHPPTPTAADALVVGTGGGASGAATATDATIASGSGVPEPRCGWRGTAHATVNGPGDPNAYFKQMFTGHASTERLLLLLNLSHPGLQRVKLQADAGDPVAAAAALLPYFRQRVRDWKIVSHIYPFMRNETAARLAMNNTLTHLGGATTPRVVKFGPAGINWTHNPFWAKEADAEWAWGVHRQPFWMSMAWLYKSSHDEQIVAVWTHQFKAWLAGTPRDHLYNYDWGQPFAWKNGRTKPLASRVWPNPAHPETSWGWRRVDAGRRGMHLPELLGEFVGSEHFTPDVLVSLLNSLHEHAHFLACDPARGFTRDNHGIFEAEGAAFIAVLFPEFIDAEAWRVRSFQVLLDQIHAQVRPDGLQIENVVSYHLSSMRIFTDTPRLAIMNGLQAFPPWYWAAVKKMIDAIHVVAFPDGGGPQFGDHAVRSSLAAAMKKWDQFWTSTGKLAAAGVGAESHITGAPNATAAPLSFGQRLPYSGWYKIAGRTGPEAPAFLLRCGPSYNAHSHKDAGSFELSAGGRLLLQDSGCYTYTGIKEQFPADPDRKYFQSTAAHNTLTLDMKDAHVPSLINGPYKSLKGYDDCGLLRWSPDDAGNANVVVENRHTYRNPDLSHRRSMVYFDRLKAFVVVDEAIGAATGDVAVHFHFAIGSGLAKGPLSATSAFSTGTNIVVAAQAGASSAGIKMHVGRSQASSRMGTKKARPVVSFSCLKKTAAPVRVVTVLAPFATEAEGAAAAGLKATVVQPAGANSTTIQVTTADGTEHVYAYEINPDNLQMTPTSAEFENLAEDLYEPYYANFRRAHRLERETGAEDRRPHRCRGPGCDKRAVVAGDEEHIVNKRAALVVSETRKFLYCGIPKCGVSRWRRLIRRIEGVESWADKMAHIPEANGLKYLFSYSPAEATRLANDPEMTIMMIVRNPYARLLSGWLDKRDFPQFNLPQNFEDFVRYVSNTSDTKLNEHFKPMASFCGVREGMLFTDILKLEEVDVWGPEIVRRLNLTDAVKSGWKGGFFPSTVDVPLHNHNAAKRLREFYTQDLMRAIATRYKDDFATFNYDPAKLT